MPKHHFSALVAHYPEIIQEMPGTFTSHRFILTLAQNYQRLYIEALYSYRDEPAPLRIVHGILAKRLHDFPRQIELIRPDVPSTNIFRQSNPCAEWRKL
ncbi:MAG: hypothetical protein WBW48_01395 [Anaerolineae bacterium]